MKSMNIKKICQHFGLFCLLSMIASAPVSASDAGPTTANQLIGAMDGHAYFEGSQNRTARPGCATLTRWAINLSSPAGQAILSILISGIATGKSFAVSGQGTCVFDSELVYAIRVVN